MGFFNKTYNDASTFKKVIIFLLIISIFVGFACGLFYQQVQGTIQEESKHYLREISDRTTSNIQRIIKDNFAILDTMKSVIENNNIQHFDVVSKFLMKQIELWDFTNIILIDNSGLSYDLQGNKVSITGDSFLRTLSTNKKFIAPTQIVDNEEKTVFSIPLNNIVIENRNIIAVAAVYNPKQFDAILSMDSFEEQAYSCIVNKNGNVVVRSSSKYATDFGYNIFQSILGIDQSAHSRVNQLKQDINNNASGQLQFTLTNSDEYLVYTPIGVEDWHLFTFVPTSVVNAKSILLLQSTLIMTALIFVVFIIFLAIIVYTFMRNKKRLEDIAYVDTLTNGHTIRHFYDLVNNALLKNADKHYAIVFSNIQRFKVLNDQFGRLTCDQILICLHDGVKADLQSREYIGHYAADNFVTLVEYKDDESLQQRFKQWEILAKQLANEVMDVLPIFTVEYGIYIIEDISVNIEDMIDRTKFALRNGNIAHGQDDHIRYAYYNEEVRHQLMMEKHLEDIMETALLNNEFKMFLQPKYNTGTKNIGGAEALVRWQSSTGGMIYPNDFIPLFEKNGFIVKLDLWMFEQACRLLQSWKDSGKPLICISVNCSRIHLKNQRFLQSYVKIFEKYDFPAKYLELEFTENMLFEETEHFAKVIDDIHAIGFACSMDDFGSGYSSLNILQDIHVDTLKLDGGFFKKAFSNSERTRSIISCILDMAKSLHMKTVAEGIEEWEQVEILHDLGCNYIQGYVYAKPMPVDEFEQLLHSKS